jgi:decaprenylphospho-beta-D-ribofuranose 2-oxidase
MSDGGDIDAIIGSASGGVIARGGGRNYGDAADITGGSVVILDSPRSMRVDPSGQLTVDGGATLGEILEKVHPLGWTLPVVPATRHVTVGGAIASDVHGKNHRTAGSFGRHVEELTLVSPTGTHRVSRELDQDLMSATCGGMGLTGVVTEAKIRLRPAATSRLMARHHRCASLDELMAVMSDADDEFCIAWIDAFATGASTGRGYVVTARWATLEDVGVERGADPRAVRWRSFGTVPRGRVPRLIHTPTIRAMNTLWYARARRHAAERAVPFDEVLMPLDAVEGWNRLYGRAGFVQYQFVVPDSGAEFIGRCLDRLRSAGCHSCFTTMKRLGPPSGSHLSFARDGWSLSLDIPRRAPSLLAVLDELDDELVAAGGRVYLAKDSRMNGRHIASMYPIDGFLKVKSRVDPASELRSDLSVRLGLGGA